MIPKNVRGYSVEVCPQCEGMWTKDKALEEMFSIRITKGRVIQCPDCNTPMMKEHIGNIELDICHSCGRVWLDKSELAKLWFSHKK